MTLYLHGLGHFHPENEITNRFLEELDIGTSDQWIMERVGIRSRRTMMPLDYIRETRNKDPRMALEAADYSGAQIGARFIPGSSVSFCRFSRCKSKIQISFSSSRESRATRAPSAES